MSDFELIYDPFNGLMKSVAFASGVGTNFNEAVIASRLLDSKFSVDLLITDKEIDRRSKEDDKRIGALKYADQFRVQHRTKNGLRFCGSWEEAKKTTEGIKLYEEKTEKFNHALLQIVKEFEEQQMFTFDLAILTGYMRLFNGDLLRRFYRKAINVHDAHLAALDCNGKRKFVGNNAIRDALAAGEKRTCSSIIIVDHGMDSGAILVTGPWADYNGTDSAEEHQKKQKRISDWPALRFALEEIANGNFALHKKKFHHDGNPVVLYKGREMPYEGYVLKR